MYRVNGIFMSAEEYRVHLLSETKAKEGVPKKAPLLVYCFPGYSSEAGFLENYKIVSSIAEAQLVVFGGGTDIDSKLYGERRGPHTGTPDVARDDKEVAGYKEAVRLGIPCIGVCRGLN